MLRKHKKVFSFFLKVGRVGGVLTSAGTVYQSSFSYSEVSPCILQQEYNLWRNADWLPSERSDRLQHIRFVAVHSSVYIARSVWTRCVRQLTTSAGLISALVTWSRGLRSQTRRATAFDTHCNGARQDCGSSASNDKSLNNINDIPTSAGSGANVAGERNIFLWSWRYKRASSSHNRTERQVANAVGVFNCLLAVLSERANSSSTFHSSSYTSDNSNTSLMKFARSKASIDVVVRTDWSSSMICRRWLWRASRQRSSLVDGRRSTCVRKLTVFHVSELRGSLASQSSQQVTELPGLRYIDITDDTAVSALRAAFQDAFSVSLQD